MRCEDIRQLIPEWLDGEVPAGEAQEIENHVAGCEACAKEVGFWQQVTAALGEANEEIKAPPGFAAGVIAQLPSQTSRKSIFSRWKQSIAAAAAFLLVAAGSAGAYFHWQDNSNYIATHDPSPPGLVMNDPGQNDEQVNGSGDVGINEPVDNQGNSGDSQTGSSSSKTPGTDGSTATTRDNGTPNAGNNKPKETIRSEQYALLNSDKQRVVERSLVQVQVDDLDAAHNKALNIINSFGASYEILGSEVTATGAQESIKITVSSENSAQLLGNLEGLGQKLTGDRQKDDLTARYNDKVEQYMALHEQAEAAEGPAEKEQIRVKMKGIESQLKAWEREVQTHTIILWLKG